MFNLNTYPYTKHWHCLDGNDLQGFAYAANQYQYQCFCGDSYNKYGAADNCNMACVGNASQTCGGNGANQVYKGRLTLPRIVFYIIYQYIA